MNPFLTILCFVFLFSTSLIISVRSAIMKLGSIATVSEFQQYPSFYFLYIWIHRNFHKERWSGLFHYLSVTSQITRLFFAALSVFFAFDHHLIDFDLSPSEHQIFVTFFSLVGVISFIALFSLFFDFIFKLLAFSFPYFALKVFTIPVSFIVLIFSWLTYPILTIEKKLIIKPLNQRTETSEKKIKRKLEEFLFEPEIKQLLTHADQKLLVSLASFKDRVTKEVMTPRVVIFALAADETVASCLDRFIEEGYSRVPVFEENIDHIVGVLLYKDLLKFVQKHLGDVDKSYLKTPIRELLTPALFAPESKKISQLLQDFKAHQTHLAIIVDEYGGTEGIVTIEDILEELVGEIADEYDLEEEKFYTQLPNGSWIVDPKMSILEIEKELGISIPEAPEYETIGGYIFHTAGSIPKKGWCIHHEYFDLEVISSTPRFIEKIKITPVSPSKH